MNKLVEDSVDAFCEGREFHRSNMAVERFGPHINIYQHGHLIAQRNVDKGLYDTRISCAGWWTSTTKERLTALLWRTTMSAWSMHQINGDWVLHSHTHGQSLPFHGTANVEDLIDLDETIIKERLARVEARNPPVDEYLVGIMAQGVAA